MGTIEIATIIRHYINRADEQFHVSCGRQNFGTNDARLSLQSCILRSMHIRMNLSSVNISCDRTLLAIVDAVIHCRNMIAICADRDRDETVDLIVEAVNIEIVARFFSSVSDADAGVAIEEGCSTTLSNRRVV